MNSPKQNKIQWPLDNRLDLSKNRVDIDSSFSLYKTKNSPMYNEAISPLYTETKEYQNRVIYNTNGDEFHYENGILYMNGNPIMETDGDGYFTREEVDRVEYDTYDIDNEGNEVWSKYNHGIITYHTMNGDYVYNVSDTQAAIVDCRARVVNNTPIIVYLFINTNGKYEVVYLKNNITYNSVISHWTQRKLPLTNYLSSGNSQNRYSANGGIVDVEAVDTSDNIKVNSPLIQIANPTGNVFVVSILTDSGGHLKPAEVGYATVVDNNNTFYNKFDWNRSTQTISMNSHATVNLNFKSSVEHKSNSTTVYQYYDDPNGPEDFEAIAKANLGKFYLTTAADPSNPNITILADEIKLDTGYEPDYSTGTATQGNYQVGSGSELQVITYTKWIAYQVLSYTDKWTMTASANSFEGEAKNAKLTFNYTVTPKKKITEDNDSETQYLDLNTEDVISKINDALFYDSRFNDKEFSRFEYQTNWSTSLAPIQSVGNEEDVQLTEDWKYKDLNNTAQNRLACLKLTKHDELNTFIYYDVEVLFRAQNRSTKVVDNTPLYFKFALTQADWTGPNNIEGMKTGHIITDFKYLNFSTSAVVTGATINYKQLVNFKSGVSESSTSNIVYETSQDWKSELGRDPYFYWTDSDPITYSKEINQSSGSKTVTFEYEYTLNNTDYRLGYELPGVNPNLPNLFEGFSKPMNIVFKTDTAGQGQYAGTYTEDYTTTYDIPYLNADQNLSKTYDWTFQSITTQNVLPNIFLDDGTAVALFYIPQFTVLPVSASFGLHCQVNSLNKIQNNTAIFNFTTLGLYDSGPYSAPGCVWDLSVDLNDSYYRIMMNVATNRGASTDQYNAALIVKSLYDTGLRTTLIAPGATTESSVTTSENNSHYYNLQGSIAKLKGKFRKPIFYGLTSGISFGEDEYIGTMLTEWNSVSEDKYTYGNENTIGYHSTDGSWYEIKYLKGDGDIDIIFDRYIIINTNGYWNCYDIERKRPIHYASDFNNRVYPGVSYKDYGSSNAMSYATGNYSASNAKYSTTESKYFVSGINSLYEVSGVAITSIQMSPQAYTDMVTGSESFCWCKQPDRYMPQYMEVFYGQATDNTMAEYQYSVIAYDKTKIKFRDNALVDLNAPIAIKSATMYSPNIFTQFIHTYNNKDLVVNGHYGYPIVYSETTPILSYTSGKQISNVDNVFVIQSQFYGIINDKIVSITYDDYTIIAIDAIIDIKGMIYLGYLPTMAYFFSPADRCIYTFTGDANLDIQAEATGISKIYKIYYNTASESIFVATDVGVVIISGKQVWKIDVVNVDNIYFIKDGYFIITHKEDDKFVSTAYSYESSLLKAPIKQKVILESKYVGPGSGKIATTDNIQVILISEKEEAGEISLESSTFTDTGFKSETKSIKISKELWKNGENAIVCNFFPKYQTGQGFKWKITSDFAIDSVVQSITEKTGATLTQLNG